MTKGYQLTFYTEKNRRHGHQSVVECLLSIAKLVGIHGATVLAASEGVGHAGARHAARFFELADQPQLVIFAVTEGEADGLLEGRQYRGQVTGLHGQAKNDFAGDTEFAEVEIVARYFVIGGRRVDPPTCFARRHGLSRG